MAHTFWKKRNRNKDGGNDALFTEKVRKCMRNRFYMDTGEGQQKGDWKRVHIHMKKEEAVPLRQG